MERTCPLPTYKKVNNYGGYEVLKDGVLIKNFSGISASRDADKYINARKKSDRAAAQQ